MPFAWEALRPAASIEYLRWTSGIGDGLVTVVVRDGDATEGMRDSGVVWAWRSAVGSEEFVAMFPAGAMVIVIARAGLLLFGNVYMKSLVLL